MNSEENPSSVIIVECLSICTTMWFHTQEFRFDPPYSYFCWIVLKYLLFWLLHTPILYPLNIIVGLFQGQPARTWSKSACCILKMLKRTIYGEMRSLPWSWGCVEFYHSLNLFIFLIYLSILQIPQGRLYLTVYSG